MISSFLIRCITLVLGYMYPAYECFKSLERNRPDIHQLRFWCEYWIIIAIVTVFERLADTFISWLPMYSEAKLAFIVYLWYPKTKGTTYVYSTFLKPLVASHELEIDRNLNELKTRAGDMAFLYWQKCSGYIQTRFFELLQYVASQSQPSRPQAADPSLEHAQIDTAAPAACQAVPGYQPCVGHQIPAGHQPTAPPLPVEYEAQPPAVFQPAIGIHQQDLHGEADFEIMDGRDQPVPPNEPEPAIKSSFYMTRSRQRTNFRQQ